MLVNGETQVFLSVQVIQRLLGYISHASPIVCCFGDRRFGHFVAAVVLMVCAPCSVGADKNGLSPNSISLPTGPGSIEGLGSSFQPMLNTGTPKYRVEIKVPPGSAGHAPNLSLSYEGGTGNGPLGFGWQISIPYIQRQTDKGIPTYGENLGVVRQDQFLNQEREELVPQEGGVYFSKNEGAFIRYRRAGDHWEADLPNGSRLEFGTSSKGQIVDQESGHVFCWLLEKEIDLHGNVILYTHRSFADSHSKNQRFLSKVEYGAGPPPWKAFHFVSLEYEARPDWFEDCRAGFVVRTGMRLRGVTIGTQGPVLAAHLEGDFSGDGIGDFLDRRYDLGYFNYAGDNSHWSLLGSIHVVGADGKSELPPTSFGYSVCNPPDQISAVGHAIVSDQELPFLMDSDLVDLVDLDGDGLGDILQTEALGGPHKAIRNLGSFSTKNGVVIRWSAASEILSADGLAYQTNLRDKNPSAYLADMDGDGLSDLVVNPEFDRPYFFRNEGNLEWGPQTKMSIQDAAPPAPFGNPDIRTADLDFDKKIDIVQSIQTGAGISYQVWFNLGNQTYSPGIIVSQNSGFSFADETTQIVDFNGDRVADIVQIHPREVVVTSGLGYGRFSEPIRVSIPEIVLDDFQVLKAKLVDITGDGLADLVLERAEPGRLWYWVNLGNYTFSNEKMISGMPVAVGLNAAVRWADLDGNGTVDLVYADREAAPQMQIVDLGSLLNCGQTPNLLNTISNGIGGITCIGYQSSTEFYLQDAREGHRWTNYMPFAVSVAACVTNLDSLGHKYVTKFRYHDGYYDSVEKQFRGFARVEQIDVGDVSAPTLVTRSHFDTGRDLSK
jgi:hypothetical protein